MKVSVITVVYNGGEFIGDAVRSVLGQDYGNMEYIIVDGGSTDGTLDVIGKYRDGIAKVVSEPDEGIYDAMNKGVGMASGEVIALLNADDLYAHEGVISRVVREMSRTGADCCYGDLVYVRRGDIGTVVRYWEAGPYERGLFRTGWHPPHPCFMARRSVYQRYGAFDRAFPIAADYELMLRLMEGRGISAVYIPDILVKMRTGGNSNRSIGAIARANLEVYRAWRKNKLPVTPLIVLKKPLSKVKQLGRRPREGSRDTGKRSSISR